MKLEDILSEHYNRKITDINYSPEGQVVYKYEDGTYESHKDDVYDIVNILVHYVNKYRPVVSTVSHSDSYH